ncbi:MULTISPECIES: peptidylprolyl isomerase [unclassified Xanthobacter]|uniref:peptidylprolyl isomerase n=1 Tax=unclassified Xanthobacter TaxID=2623496 RepID=UPI001EDE68E4|nr:MULTISPECIES: peptidylprolyl isomerase [unclassified Xanthobacter]
MVLQTLRKGASGWIAKLFLIVLTLSFVVWGIADVFRGFGASTIATVGKTEIPAADFRNQYLEQIQMIGRRTGRGLTQEQARAFGLDRQVLNQMLADATLDEEAHRLGLAIGDAQMAQAIADNPNYRRPGADSFDAAYFDQLLRANGLTEQRFVAAEKKRALRDQVLQSLGAGITAPKVLLDALHRFDGEMRNVSYVLVTAGVARDLAAPTDEQLKAYFESHKVSFRAPEYRKISVLALTPQTLAGGITITNDEAKAAYEHEIARFGSPEQRELQQIVFAKPDEATAALERIKAGTPFVDIAKERGLTAADTDLGLVAKGAIIDPKIADAAFALDDGATSGPVQGRFGTVLVHVARVVPGTTQPFDAVKGELMQELALAKARRELLDKHDAIEDERASGATLAEAAQKLGLKLDVIDAVDRSGHTPAGTAVEVPGGADVIAGAFAAAPGVETDTVQLPQNGGFVWYETNAVTPSRDRTFEEAKALVVTRWRDAEIAKAVEAKAKELLAKAEAGTPLAEVAGAAELPLQTMDGLRRGRADGNFSTESVQAVFQAKDGGFGMTAAATAPGRIVFQVTKVIEPPPGSDPRVAADLTQQMENDLLLQYLNALQSQIGVHVNQQVFAQSVGADAVN